MLEKYMKHVVTRPPITKHAVFNTFVMLKPDFDEIEEELAAKVAALGEIAEAKWKQTTEKHGVKIWTLDEKLDGSNFLVVRTYVKVGVSLKDVCETYNTKSEWTKWQPDLKVCKVCHRHPTSSHLWQLVWTMSSCLAHGWTASQTSQPHGGCVGSFPPCRAGPRPPARRCKRRNSRSSAWSLS